MIALAYERWSITRSSNYRALVENILVNILYRWSLMGVGRLQEVIAHREWTVSIKTLMKDSCSATTSKLATFMKEKSVGLVFHRASFSFKSFLAYNTYDKVMPFSLCQILENKALNGSLRKMN